MSTRPLIAEDRLLRFGAALTGLILLASAGLAAALAREHMTALGAICGANNAPHCFWCLGAASLVLTGLAGLAYAARPPADFRTSGLLKIKAGRRRT
jgi:hypothetical protein